jgi:hypothetical protein
VQTSYAARIMGLFVIPFIIAQFPKMLKTHHGQRLTMLLALVVSFALVLAYCLYQVNEIYTFLIGSDGSTRLLRVKKL